MDKTLTITKETMRIGSLFSGIGGLDLGLEWAGVGHTVWQVERDPFCRSVLERHWPDAQRFDDVCTVGAHNLEPVDVICGGFPCQDISYAGKGLGLSGERSGLWYEFARIVGEMGPRYVVVENVAALITRGIGDVLGTLSDLGYDAQWRAIRASDVGAPHRRERIFFVAYANGAIIRSATELRATGSLGVTRGKEHGGCYGRGRREWASEPRLGRGAHGLPSGMARWPAGPGQTQHEREPPRTIEKADNRAAKLRALGNAVVPQVAQEIGKWLLEINDAMTNHYERNSKQFDNAIQQNQESHKTIMQ